MSVLKPRTGSDLQAGSAICAEQRSVHRTLYKIDRMIGESLPRLYPSFEAFERDERQRRALCLPARPSSTAAPVVPCVPEPPSAPLSPTRTTAHATSTTSTTSVTPAALHAEGILEIGRALGTSALFVRTRVKLHLLHVTWLPDRKLDSYAVDLAVIWIQDHGLPGSEVARNLGVSEPSLRTALAAAGYARLSPAQHAQRAKARSIRKFGNRRGRLVRSLAATATGAPRP